MHYAISLNNIVLKLSILGLGVVALAGCVYRQADIPVVTETLIKPQTVFVETTLSSPHPVAAQAWAWQQASQLASDLQQAGFHPVVVSDLAIVPVGAVVIELMAPVNTCFAEPMLTILTVGLIPHVGCQQYGYQLVIHHHGATTPKQFVNAQFTVKEMVGWLTWPAAWSKAYVYDANGGEQSAQAHAVVIRLLAQQLTAALSVSRP